MNVAFLSNVPQDSSLRAFLSRDETLATLRRKKRFDVLVVGGGLQGATMAWLGSLQGLSVVLLERGHYGSGYSSFAPPLLDLGVLQPGTRVFNARKRRAQMADDWRTVAPHLISRRRALDAFQGLSLLARFRTALSSWSWSHDIAGVDNPSTRDPFGSFTVHQHDIDCVDVERLNAETLIMARQEGALCLNYAEVKAVQSRNSAVATVTFHDARGENDYQLQCGVVCNCAGWSAASVGRITSGQGSRGTIADMHAASDTPWTEDPVVVHEANGAHYVIMALARGGTGIWRFGMPHLDNEAQSLERDVKALREMATHFGIAHLSEPILARRVPLKNPFEMHYSAAGPSYRLTGFNPLQMRETARSILSDILGRAGRTDPVLLPTGRPYPGAADLRVVRERFIERAIRTNLPTHVVEEVLQRLGARVRYFDDSDDFLLPLGKSHIVGEAILAIVQEQIENPHDLIRHLRCEQEVRDDSVLQNQIAAFFSS